MRVTSTTWLWVASAAFIALVGLAAYMFAVNKTDNHHTIVSVETDHPGDRCYMLLDSADRPIQMSCVTGGRQPWSTTTTTAQW